MIIAKKDMQHLIDADTGVLPLARADITVFNLKTNRLARLNITDALRSDDIVCLCDPANQPWDRPPPEPVDASMFRKLGQDELEDGFHFNNLIFAPEISGGRLVVLYKGRPVYEESIYLLFECVDDEPDERMEVSAFFEDRMGSLGAALKAAYGRSARLEHSTAYPAIRVTQDITGWMCEQLEASVGDTRDDLLAVLKFLLLEAGSEAVFSNFLKMASSPFGDTESIVDALFTEYIRYCGISAGYRTGLWDGMVAVYAYFDRDPDHGKIVERIEARFETEEFREFQDYDIVVTSPVETLVLLKSLFRNEEIACREAVAVAAFCFALTGGAS